MNQIKKLFTPGPLTTSDTVRSAAGIDLGSRDFQFISIVKQIREELLELGHANAADYQTILIQGSGTFGVESVISSSIPPEGKLLNIINGAYGQRISQMARIHQIPLVELIYEENQVPEVNDVEALLEEDSSITHIAMVHGETTTGLLNPIAKVGMLAKIYHKTYIVDAMSTFGAYPISLVENNIDFLISSSNKCIEGIPGFSFVLARRQALEACKGNARSLSLDLYAQWKGLEENGQFRFTPPVQSLLAFKTALDELTKEGGVEARGRRYAENNRILMQGMLSMGFEQYLSDENRSYIITSFLYPNHPSFDFNRFYSLLNEKGFVIYPGKLSKVDCFRIGNIGQLFPGDLAALLEAIRLTLNEMEINLL